MNQPHRDHVFAGSVPQIYERYPVPLIFEPSTVDLAARTERHAPSRVLEIAAGTGTVTRHFPRWLGPQVIIVATGLNPAMLEHEASVGIRIPVRRQTADAMQMPFADQEFDTVVCQFGHFSSTQGARFRQGQARVASRRHVQESCEFRIGTSLPRFPEARDEGLRWRHARPCFRTASARPFLVVRQHSPSSSAWRQSVQTPGLARDARTR